MTRLEINIAHAAGIPIWVKTGPGRCTDKAYQITEIDQNRDIVFFDVDGKSCLSIFDHTSTNQPDVVS